MVSFYLFLIVLAGFLGFLGALIVQKKQLAKDLRFKQLTHGVPRCKIRDAPPGGRVILTGKVSSAGDAVRTAPFSGGEALWARASLNSQTGNVVEQWFERVDEIRLDDGSEQVARIGMQNAQVWLPEQPATGKQNSERAEEYVALQLGQDSKRSGFYYESVLRPGTIVNVLGTVRSAQGSYRDRASDLRFADDQPVLIFDRETEFESVPHRRALIRTTAIIVVVLGTIAVVLLKLATT